MASCLDSGGTGVAAYAEAVAMYLAFAVDRGANYLVRSLCAWRRAIRQIVSNVSADKPFRWLGISPKQMRLAIHLAT